MATQRKPRLKVFQAQFGFYDSVIATPSRAAALRAWGTHQDLFASGDARETADEAATAAALAHPGTPLRRALGGKGAFEVQPDSLPEAPATSGRAAKARPAKPRPDRKTLDAAEKALRRLDDRWDAEAADLNLEQESLDRRRAEAKAAYDAARRETAAVLSTARAAYRKVGGKD